MIHSIKKISDDSWCTHWCQLLELGDLTPFIRARSQKLLDGKLKFQILPLSTYYSMSNVSQEKIFVPMFEKHDDEISVVC